jgi:two-component system osmolarity sensor histidine kinase EnvZ
MKLVPSSLFGRLALLLVAVVVVGQLAAVLVFRQDRASLLTGQFNETKIAQLLALREALAESGTREHGPVMRIGRAYGARIARADERPMMGMMAAQGPEFDALAQFLSRRLGEPTEVRVAPRMGMMWISLNAGDTAYWAGFPLPPPPARDLPYRLLAWNAIIIVLLVGAAWWFARRLGRPLRELSAAVATVGQGGRPPPLPETGPTEIAALAGGLNRMTASLDRHERERALLLAGVSHDLRTPLARLRLGLEMLPGDDAAKAGLVEDIEEMDRSLGQLLEFARGEDAVPSELASLDEIVATHLDRLRREGRRVEFVAGGVPAAPLRVESVKRLVQNLVDNAFRYGSPEVQVVTRVEAGCALLEVADRGPGIPPDQVERLKQPFTRLDSSRSGPPGAGLGLAIVDRVARSHGGTFDLLPRPGGGTIAVVSIPLAGAAPEGAATAGTAPLGTSRGGVSPSRTAPGGASPSGVPPADASTAGHATRGR